MAGSNFFGFNTTQAKTLDRLMNSDDSGLAALSAAVTALQGAVTQLQEDLSDLTDRVDALEP